MIEKIKDLLKKEPFTAQDAYSIATYGEKLSNDEIIAKVISRTIEIISAKAIRGEYAMVQYIDEKIPNIEESVKEHFTKLGFKVSVIDSSIIDFVEGKYIFISWNK